MNNLAGKKAFIEGLDYIYRFFNFLLDQKVAKNQGFRQIPTKRRSLR
jgi:hypothetical protein